MIKNALLFLTFCVICLPSFGQRNKFDCHAINNDKLMSAYNNLKSYGLEYVVKTDKGDKKDIMEFAIYFLKYEELRQLCINAWADVEENGADYCYNRYVKLRGYVDKSVYMDNIDYFEMLHSIRTLLGNSY